MSNRGWGAYCEEAGHEKGTNKKKKNYIYIKKVNCQTVPNWDEDVKLGRAE